MSKKLRGTLNPANLNMVFLGKEGVGKTAMLVRFLTRRFIGEYDPDLETTHRRHLTFGNCALTLDIKDTAGENDTPSREHDFRIGDIFILIFSVTDEKSFKDIQHLHKVICLSRTKPFFVVIANKTDLNHLRVITEVRGKNLADKFQCPYYEVSTAEDYTEIQKMFEEIIRYTVQRKAQEENVSYKKRANSFTNLLKAIEKQQKLMREKKDEKHDILDLLRISPAP